MSFWAHTYVGPLRCAVAVISLAPPVLSATLRELSNDRDAFLADTRRQAGDGGEA